MKKSIAAPKSISVTFGATRLLIIGKLKTKDAVTAPLALSLGDPCGIGPEIVAKAWASRDVLNLPAFFALGDRRGIEAIWSGPIVQIDDPAEAELVFWHALPVLNLENSGAILPGEPNLEGAQNALAALELAVGLARSGAASAIVTAPVSKAQLYSIGFTHPGQTEFVAERCGITSDNAVMMLASKSLRVVPITVHIPFGDVPSKLSTDLIIQKAKATIRGLAKDFGIQSPRLAVAGLNPHAGENGKLGREEIDIIRPAIEALNAQGINAFGPISPDALFTPRAREGYDAALCMYHDQALIPLKALFIDEGVNMTLGLPIIRTSPDHGTAFDLAGQNRADPGAMIAAIEMAASAVHFRAIYAI
jgi:4-hydroxythreonine-4-phosphate dehydrogenase